MQLLRLMLKNYYKKKLQKDSTCVPYSYRCGKNKIKTLKRKFAKVLIIWSICQNKRGYVQLSHTCVYQNFHTTTHLVFILIK